MYAASGLSALIFIVHGLWRYGWEIQNERMALRWMGLMALFNLIGAGFYASRVCTSIDNTLVHIDIYRQFPEACYPYIFDIFGGSHQIFHIMVILAGLAHMAGLLQAFDYTHVSGSQCDRG